MATLTKSSSLRACGDARTVIFFHAYVIQEVGNKGRGIPHQFGITKKYPDSPLKPVAKLVRLSLEQKILDFKAFIENVLSVRAL